MFKLPINTERNLRYFKKEICDILNWGNKEKKLIKMLYKSIDSINVVNEISNEEIPAIQEGDEIKNISFILIKLKDEDIEEELLKQLFMSLKKGIVFVLDYNENYKVAFFYNKVLISDYIDETYAIKLDGSNFDTIYQNLIIDICKIEIINDNTLYEQIKMDDDIKKMQDEIKMLESKCKNEKQFNKKVEIIKKINILKKEMQGIKMS